MNVNTAAAFVTAIALGVSFAFAAAFGFWLWDALGRWFARTETHVGTTDDLAAIGEAVKRHPSTRRES